MICVDAVVIFICAVRFQRVMFSSNIAVKRNYVLFSLVLLVDSACHERYVHFSFELSVVVHPTVTDSIIL